MSHARYPLWPPSNIHFACSGDRPFSFYRPFTFYHPLIESFGPPVEWQSLIHARTKVTYTPPYLQFAIPTFSIFYAARIVGERVAET